VLGVKIHLLIALALCASACDFTDPEVSDSTDGGSESSDDGDVPPPPPPGTGPSADNGTGDDDDDSADDDDDDSADDDDDDSADDDDDDSDDDDDDDTANGPVIIDLSSNITELGPESVVRITAIVTDPDGIRDVIGGSLTNEADTVTYGALATESQEGAYTLELSWGEINVAEPIDFTGSMSRTFVASFFDTAGHQTSANIELGFSCQFEDGACGGVCMYLQSFNACGACDVQCEGFESCVDFECSLTFSCDPLDAGDCPGQECHSNGFDFLCGSGSGEGVQGDDCGAGGVECGAGFDCYSAADGDPTCLGYCMLDDPQCTNGSTCLAVEGVPLWEGMGLCA